MGKEEAPLSENETERFTREKTDRRGNRKKRLQGQPEHLNGGSKSVRRHRRMKDGARAGKKVVRGRRKERGG